MALRPEQLKIVGQLYHDSSLLFDWADDFLIGVEAKSPRNITLLQERLIQMDFILRAWFLPVRYHQLLESGLDQTTVKDILALLTTFKQTFDANILLPEVKRGKFQLLEAILHGSLEHWMFTMEGLINVLAGCVVAALAEEAYAYEYQESKTEGEKGKNILFFGLRSLEKWCLALKELEQATQKVAQEKEWSLLAKVLEEYKKFNFPVSLITAVQEQDEMSYWLQPWDFDHWIELHQCSDKKWGDDVKVAQLCVFNQMKQEKLAEKVEKNKKPQNKNHKNTEK